MRVVYPQEVAQPVRLNRFDPVSDSACLLFPFEYVTKNDTDVTRGVTEAASSSFYGFTADGALEKTSSSGTTKYYNVPHDTTEFTLILKLNSWNNASAWDDIACLTLQDGTRIAVHTDNNSTFYIYQSGLSLNGYDGAGEVTAPSPFVVLRFSKSKGLLSYSVDDNTRTATGYDSSSSVDTLSLFGRIGTSARNIAGEASYVYCFDKYLSDEEIQEIRGNPYSILEKESQRKAEYMLAVRNTGQYHVAPDQTISTLNSESLEFECEFRYSGSGNLVFFNDNQGDNCHLRVNDTGALRLRMTGTGIVINNVVDTRFIDGDWHIMRLVFDPTADLVYIYLDDMSTPAITSSSVPSYMRFEFNYLLGNYWTDTQSMNGDVRYIKIKTPDQPQNSRYWIFDKTQTEFVKCQWTGAIATLVGFPADTGYIRGKDAKKGAEFSGNMYVSNFNIVGLPTETWEYEFKLKEWGSYWYRVFGDTTTASASNRVYANNSYYYHVYNGSGTSWPISPPQPNDVFKMVNDGTNAELFVNGESKGVKSAIGVAFGTFAVNNNTYYACTAEYVKFTNTTTPVNDRYFNFLKTNGVTVPDEANGQDATIHNLPALTTWTTETEGVLGYRMNAGYWSRLLIPTWTLAGDFEIEWNGRPVGSQQQWFYSKDGSTPLIWLASNNQLNIKLNGSTTHFQKNSLYSGAVWNWKVTRVGSTCEVFINGNSEGTFTYSGNVDIGEVFSNCFHDSPTPTAFISGQSNLGVTDLSDSNNNRVYDATIEDNDQIIETKNNQHATPNQTSDIKWQEVEEIQISTLGVGKDYATYLAFNNAQKNNNNGLRKRALLFGVIADTAQINTYNGFWLDGLDIWGAEGHRWGIDCNPDDFSPCAEIAQNISLYNSPDVTVKGVRCADNIYIFGGNNKADFSYYRTSRPLQIINGIANYTRCVGAGAGTNATTSTGTANVMNCTLTDRIVQKSGILNLIDSTVTDSSGWLAQITYAGNGTITNAQNCMIAGNEDQVNDLGGNVLNIGKSVMQSWYVKHNNDFWGDGTQDFRVNETGQTALVGKGVFGNDILKWAYVESGGLTKVITDYNVDVNLLQTVTVDYNLNTTFIGRVQTGYIILMELDGVPEQVWQPATYKQDFAKPYEINGQSPLGRVLDCCIVFENAGGIGTQPATVPDIVKMYQHDLTMTYGGDGKLVGDGALKCNSAGSTYGTVNSLGSVWAEDVDANSRIYYLDVTVFSLPLSGVDYLCDTAGLRVTLYPDGSLIVFHLNQPGDTSYDQFDLIASEGDTLRIITQLNKSNNTVICRVNGQLPTSSVVNNNLFAVTGTNAQPRYTENALGSYGLHTVGFDGTINAFGFGVHFNDGELTAQQITDESQLDYPILVKREVRQDRYALHWQTADVGEGLEITGLSGNLTVEITLAEDMPAVFTNTSRYLFDGRRQAGSTTSNGQPDVHLNGNSVGSKVTDLKLNGAAATVSDFHTAQAGDVLSFKCSSTYGDTIIIGTRYDLSSTTSIAGLVLESVKLTDNNGIHYYLLDQTSGASISPQGGVATSGQLYGFGGSGWSPLQSKVYHTLGVGYDYSTLEAFKTAQQNNEDDLHIVTWHGQTADTAAVYFQDLKFDSGVHFIAANGDAVNFSDVDAAGVASISYNVLTYGIPAKFTGIRFDAAVFARNIHMQGCYISGNSELRSIGNAPTHDQGNIIRNSILGSVNNAVAGNTFTFEDCNITDRYYQLTSGTTTNLINSLLSYSGPNHNLSSGVLNVANTKVAANQNLSPDSEIDYEINVDMSNFFNDTANGDWRIKPSARDNYFLGKGWRGSDMCSVFYMAGAALSQVITDYQMLANLNQRAESDYEVVINVLARLEKNYQILSNLLGEVSVDMEYDLNYLQSVSSDQDYLLYLYQTVETAQNYRLSLLSAVETDQNYRVNLLGRVEKDYEVIVDLLGKIATDFNQVINLLQSGEASYAIDVDLLSQAVTDQQILLDMLSKAESSHEIDLTLLERAQAEFDMLVAFRERVVSDYNVLIDLNHRGQSTYQMWMNFLASVEGVSDYNILINFMETVSTDQQTLIDLLQREVTNQNYDLTLVGRGVTDYSVIMDLVGRVEKDQTYLLDMYQRVEKDFQYRFTLLQLGQASTDFSIVFDLRQKIETAFEAELNLLQKETGDYTIVADLLNTVTMDFVNRFDLLQRGEADFTITLKYLARRETTYDVVFDIDSDIVVIRPLHYVVGADRTITFSAEDSDIIFYEGDEDEDSTTVNV